LRTCLKNCNSNICDVGDGLKLRWVAACMSNNRLTQQKKGGGDFPAWRLGERLNKYMLLR
jgi:hypothetical protein